MNTGGPGYLDVCCSGCNGRGIAAPNGPGNGGAIPHVDHHPKLKKGVVARMESLAASAPRGQEVAQQSPTTPPAAGAD
jgi:hypothetical protein